MAAFDARRGSRSTPEGTDAEPGFAGQLRCASLADLIQLECGNRTRVAVSVRSEEREGHLFFADGQIVHACTGDRVGEPAVFELLEWTTGTFGQSNEPWPDTASVTSSWQQLLVMAAQRRDELQEGLPAASTSRFIALKKTQPSAPVSAANRTAPSATSLPPLRKALNSSVLDRLACAARFDSDGNVLETKGDVQALLGLAAYVRRLAELIGQGLGQSGFQAFECRCEAVSLAVFADAPGSYVIAETAALNELKPYYHTLPI